MFAAFVGGVNDVCQHRAHVEVVVGVDDIIIRPNRTRYIDKGGYLAFNTSGKGSLLILSGSECFSIPINDCENMFYTDLDLLFDESTKNNQIRHLRYADIVLVQMNALSENLTILRGNAVVVLNDSFRLEFPITCQVMDGKHISIPDVSEYLNETLRVQ